MKSSSREFFGGSTHTTPSGYKIFRLDQNPRLTIYQFSCEADDWNEAPTGLAQIEDASLRQWALEVHDLLRQLCRRAHSDVQLNPDRHSLIYVPHAFIVPGGRFREYYYWDAYWIIKGLLSIGK